MVQALAIPLGYLTEPEDRTLLLKALDTLVAGWWRNQAGGHLETSSLPVSFYITEKYYILHHVP